MKWKGIVIAESLEDQTAINGYEVFKAQVSKEEDGYWHLYWVFASEKQIQRLQKKLKQGWYAHFWDVNVVYVVFTHKVFRLPREDHWSSPEYQEARQYGIGHCGIDERYLDFYIDD